MRARYGWFAAGLAVLLSAGGVVSNHRMNAWAQTQPAPSLLKAGETAPDFSFKTVQGKSVVLSELIGNKIVLVDFFFLSSDFCRWELLHLQKLHDRFGEKGLVVIAVNTGQTDTPANLRHYWEANKLTFAVVKNGEGPLDALKAYHVVNCPTDYLIGKDRKILSRWVGFPRKTGTERIDAALAAAGFKQP